MKPKDYHFILTEIIESVEGFFKTFRTMLVSPRAGLTTALNSKASPKILPGAFLFINLAIADLIANLPLMVSISVQDWLLEFLKEIPSHIIGTLFFLFLLKLLFWKVKSIKLLTIICLSSIVYIPYAVVMLFINLLVSQSFFNFFPFALSGNYQTISELLAPLSPTAYKAIPLFSILIVVFIWWYWLLSVGCSLITRLSTTKRVLRISLSISAYILIFIIMITIMLGSEAFSILRGYEDYEKMRTSFRNEKYAEAFVLSSVISNNKKLSPATRYRAYLIVAISQVKSFLKNDDTFRDAIVAINAEKYRDAEMIMQREIKSRLLLGDSPMRFTFKNAEISLIEASKQYNSTLYSEADDQKINLLFFPMSIPMNLFPSTN